MDEHGVPRMDENGVLRWVSTEFQDGREQSTKNDEHGAQRRVSTEYQKDI